MRQARSRVFPELLEQGFHCFAAPGLLIPGVLPELFHVSVKCRLHQRMRDGENSDGRGRPDNGDAAADHLDHDMGERRLRKKHRPVIRPAFRRVKHAPPVRSILPAGTEDGSAKVIDRKTVLLNLPLVREDDEIHDGAGLKAGHIEIAARLPVSHKTRPVRLFREAGGDALREIPGHQGERQCLADRPETLPAVIRGIGFRREEIHPDERLGHGGKVFIDLPVLGEHIRIRLVVIERILPALTSKPVIDERIPGSQKQGVGEPLSALAGTVPALDLSGHVKGQPVADRLGHLLERPVDIVDDPDAGAVPDAGGHQGGPAASEIRIADHPGDVLVGIEQQGRRFLRRAGSKEAQHCLLETCRTAVGSGSRIIFRDILRERRHDRGGHAADLLEKTFNGGCSRGSGIGEPDGEGGGHFRRGGELRYGNAGESGERVQPVPGFRVVRQAAADPFQGVRIRHRNADPVSPAAQDGSVHVRQSGKTGSGYVQKLHRGVQAAAQAGGVLRSRVGPAAGFFRRPCFFVREQISLEGRQKSRLPGRRSDAGETVEKIRFLLFVSQDQNAFEKPAGRAGPRRGDPLPPAEKAHIGGLARHGGGELCISRRIHKPAYLIQPFGKHVFSTFPDSKKTPRPGSPDRSITRFRIEKKRNRIKTIVFILLRFPLYRESAIINL